MPDDLTQALQQYFGFDHFRVGQLAIINAVMSGKDVLGVMPTGAGKSLCYQLPAIMKDGLTIVVSPLISLMKDQVDQLNALGIPATYINSSVPKATRLERLRLSIQGTYRLLYVAPERFNAAFTAALRDTKIAQFVVDEAHCISQWGHDFRPDYMRIGNTAKDIGAESISAFTATATEDVRSDIVKQLGIPESNTWTYGFFRENLRLDVVSVQSLREKMALIERYLRARPNAPGIIYCATRKHVEKVATLLDQSSAGFAIERYHGGMGEEERRGAQTRFMSEKARVMVATNAFGMGIDRQDLRFVIHFEVPGSIEAYYQEAGRAGRDGLPAECTLLFNYADTRTQQFFIDQRQPTPDTSETARLRLRAIDQARLRELVRYCYTDSCRHEAVLEYFGEVFTEAPCGTCDRCIGAPAIGAPPQMPHRKATAQNGPPLTPRVPNSDEAVVLQKILSAVARANGKAAPSIIADALIGSQSPRVIDSPLAGTRSHGLLRGWTRSSITQIITALESAGCLRKISQQRRRYELTSLGTDVMWGRASIALAAPPFGSPELLHDHAIPDLDEPSANIFFRLQEERNEMAGILGVPTYVICQDATLARIASDKPDTREAMLLVRGVGPASEARYGERFRAIIKEGMQQA